MSPNPPNNDFYGFKDKKLGSAGMENPSRAYLDDVLKTVKNGGMAPDPMMGDYSRLEETGQLDHIINFLLANPMLMDDDLRKKLEEYARSKNTKEEAADHLGWDAGGL